jgi:molybdate/tungstate transport system substrate-binding protein
MLPIFRSSRRVGARGAALLGIACLGLAAAAGCSSSSSSSSSASASSSPSSAGGVGKVTGAANVAYAGSLQLLNEKTIAPAFEQATGASYKGQGAGAVGLGKEIASGEITPNVFESIGTAPITALEPKFTSWYVQLAASPIVIAYSPASKYGSEFAQIASGKKPISDLFTIMATPGFKLGRTDPNTDPQGQAFYEMVQAAQSYYHLPAGTAQKVLGPLNNPKQAYSETSLESFLQSGQVDASSSYRSQAIQMGLHYITLPSVLNFGDPSLASTYAKYTIKLDNGQTVHGSPTVVYAAPIGKTDTAAANAFIAYQLLPSTRSMFSKGGYLLVPPKVYGTGAPSEVTNLVNGS